MSKVSPNLLDTSNKGHLFSHIQLEGAHQMALDELLLRESFSQSSFAIAFRFYSWKGAWLSIGKNQQNIPTRWKNLVNQRKIKIVRRPSGGNAVLHSGGLTYSLIWKSPPTKKREAYFQASQWLLKGFAELGLPLNFGKEKASLSSTNCFQSSTQADLIDSNGSKRVGSAQLWEKGHVLQHGEIVLNPPKELWLDLFQEKPPKTFDTKLTSIQIEEVLKKHLFLCWPDLTWEERSISDKQLEEIKSTSKNYLLRSIS